MTYADAIKANPTFLHVPNDVVEAAFVARSIESTDEYTAGGLKNLELVTADLYVQLMLMPDIVQGETSIQYNKALLRNRARNIYLKYEDERLSETGYGNIDLNITKG